MANELPPGRDLDRLIAERLMELTVRPGDDQRPDEYYDSEQDAWEELPRYSTDLAASFAVSERLREQGYTVDVGYGPDGATYVTLTTLVDGPQLFSGETPALALCRAALYVVSH
jgi:hypothetical protein